MRAHAWVLLTAVLLVFAPSAARADTDEQKAVTLFDKGRRLARDGRCAEAIAPLLESIRHAEGVGALLNLGHCYESLGKLASAHRWFSRAQQLASEREDKRRDEAAQRARSIEKDLPTLLVHVPASLRSTAEIRVDGEPWPRKDWNVPAPIDPGAHEIALTTPGRPRRAESVVVHGKGERVEWTAPEPPAAEPPARAPTPEPPTTGPPPPAPLPRSDEPRPGPEPAPASAQRTLGIVTGGAGLVGLAAGAILGVISISAHSSVVGRCPTYPQCSSRDRGPLDDMNERAALTGNLSTIGFIAGAVLVVAGAALFFSADKPSR